MGINLQVTMSNHLLNIVDGAIEGLVEGETLAAERLLALSAVEVPLDLSTLMGSGTVVPATNPEDGARVVYDTPYAVKLHEHPEYRFQKGRKGKYLEDPAVENKKELGDIIRKRVTDGS